MKLELPEIQAAREYLAQFSQVKEAEDQESLSQVMDILQNVRKYGDNALFEYTEKFDGQKLEKFKVPETWLEQSYLALEPELRQALEFIKQRIQKYEEQIKYKDKELTEFKYVYHPIEKVGFYVPGGTALYPSSVLMSIIAAQVAGVPKIYAVTPTFEENNITFATLYICGVTNVYQIGGAQAIAALAYGTESIPKVDKIVGPGNRYVALAKRLVFGEVGIDSIAGPSEILLYIDENVDPESITLDIFAQAEHDPDAKTFLLAENKKILKDIHALIVKKLPEQKRSDIITQSINNNHYSIIGEAKDLIAIINQIAPEHVSIQHANSDEIISKIHYAGAIFKGNYSPEAIGDYVAGPSHVLPTSGSARFSHGLNVNDFLTSHAIIDIEPETYQQIAPYGIKVAYAEGLYAHAESLEARLKE
ncbi:MAG: histidinol dehydrogenase [Clostridiaceae bacterium]|nr:histidinol dehydrogenase [Clostridiaceae bacterium]